MANVIFRYPDGRTGQTSEEGFAAVHEEFGAEITAYVGPNGQSFPATEEGKAEAEGAAPNELTSYAKQVEALQAREAVNVARETNAEDADATEALALHLAEEAAAAALAEREAAEALAKEAAEAAAVEAGEKPAKGRSK